MLINAFKGQVQSVQMAFTDPFADFVRRDAFKALLIEPNRRVCRADGDFIAVRDVFEVVIIHPEQEVDVVSLYLDFLSFKRQVYFIEDD